MIDPTTARNDRLQNRDRWGYTGDLLEDPMPAEESGSGSRWLLLVALIALIVIAAVMLSGSVM